MRDRYCIARHVAVNRGTIDLAGKISFCQKANLKIFVNFLFIFFATFGSCDKIEDKDEISTCTNIITPKSFLTINGRSPGPAIQVCLGDTIEVLIYNKLKSSELTFHWHGIRQKDFNYMDGVSMITQCPILPYNGFRYKINPESTGTYFYHAHSASQQGDGVYGSLTVRGPRDNASLERILVLSSRSSTPLTQQTLLYPPTPDKLLVNGQAREVFVRVRHGFSYLLRLINANVYNCPILLSAHGHSLQVLAADGNPVQSMTGTHVVLFPVHRCFHASRFNGANKEKDPKGSTRRESGTEGHP